MDYTFSICQNHMYFGTTSCGSEIILKSKFNIMAVDIAEAYSMSIPR